ncbi:hypothetical protein BKI52_04260 [marine bacterium AO1-C]|nr:hypothetical protein BKI52_04260 [marine bacterium AO1-C]
MLIDNKKNQRFKITKVYFLLVLIERMYKMLPFGHKSLNLISIRHYFVVDYIFEFHFKIL